MLVVSVFLGNSFNSVHISPTVGYIETSVENMGSSLNTLANQWLQFPSYKGFN
jgi:hypothetical protein